MLTRVANHTGSSWAGPHSVCPINPPATLATTATPAITSPVSPLDAFDVFGTRGTSKVRLAEGPATATFPAPRTDLYTLLRTADACLGRPMEKLLSLGAALLRGIGLVGADAASITAGTPNTTSADDDHRC